MTNDTTRREALIGIGAAAGLALLPQAACAQPARKIGYAIVGLGNYATNQIMPAFANCKDARITALVSGTPEKLAKYGAQYGVPDKNRYSYATFNERVARLANVLTAAGVRPGDTVAVMDWDSHRYLECMFAVPMIGAVLHTINVRLSPEQILYTMNHAEDRVVLVNAEFVPLYQAIAPHLTTVEKTLLLSDHPEAAAELPGLVGVSMSKGAPRSLNSRTCSTYSRGWILSSCSSVARGASSGSQPSQSRLSSSASIARMRSARSGWPWPVSCSSDAG